MITLIKPIVPEMILFFGACSILLLDVFKKLPRYLMEIATGVLVLSFTAIVFLSNKGSFYHGIFYISEFTTLIKIFMIFLCAFQMLAMSQMMDKYSLNKGEHSVMVLFMLVGLSIMVSSNHFLMLYIGMEIQGLAAYTITIMQRKSVFAAEAGVKYFILGSLISVIYLFGASYIYGAFGSLYFQEITTPITTSSLGSGLLGAILVMAAFLFKLGVFPLHQWVPDVYQGAPTPSVSLLATLSKIGAVAVTLLLLTGPFYGLFQAINLKLILAVIASVSMVIGVVVPIIQGCLKRLLGYSAIGHVGFMMMGFWDCEQQSIAAIIAYVLVYSFTLMMAFVCLMSLKSKEGSEGLVHTIGLDSIKGLGKVRPKHAFVLAVCFLSMAGVPPLIGFFPKLLLIKHALGKQALFMVSVALLTTVIGLFYYLKLVKLIYIDAPEQQVVKPSTKLNRVLFVIFLPAVLIQLAGCYLPVLQFSYQGYIDKAAQELIIKIE